MDIWSLLEIEETADLKSIKRAYAKKVKLVRPDEHPKDFQDLHFAYKQAMSNAKQILRRKNNQPLKLANTVQDDYSENLNLSQELIQTPAQVKNNQELDSLIYNSEPIETTESEELKQERIEQSLEKAELERAIDWINHLVRDSSRRNKLKVWKQITETKFILYSDFNWQLGTHAFKIIAEHNNKKRSKRNRYDRVEIKILKYLDSVFNWSNNEYDLRYELGDKLCNTILLNLPVLQTHLDDAKAIEGLMGGIKVKKVAKNRQMPIEFYYYAGNFVRFLALAIDLVFSNILSHLALQSYVLIFGKVSQEVRGDFLLSSTLIIYCVSSYLLEVSKFQSTIGKWVFGLKVTDQNNNRVSGLRGLARIVSFSILGIGNYLTLLINSWLGPKFMHDRISGTQVLDVRKSRKEQDKKQKWHQ